MPSEPRPLSAVTGDDLAPAVLTAIEEAIGPPPRGLHEPTLGDREIDAVTRCVESGFVSSVGAFVDAFETEVSRYTGAQHAIAVVNGTAALQVALQLAGVEPGNEVLVPALTFVATANAVAYRGAIPHFVDAEPLSLGPDPEKLRAWLEANTDQRAGQCVNANTNRRIAALIVMHVFGHPAAMDELASIADDFGVALIEDAAESLGSYHGTRHTGTIGRLGIFSFNGNKTVTTGGGGMIVTSDSELAQEARHLTTTAKIPDPFEYLHDRIGYNYRMPNLNASLGCAQMSRLPALVRAQRRLYRRYADAFAGLESVRLITEPPGDTSNYWLQAILLDDPVNRSNLLKALNAAGYSARAVWRPLHLLAPFQQCPRQDLSVAERLGQSLINIPSTPLAEDM